MIWQIRLARMLAWTTAIVALAGCGGPTMVTVKGKLLMNGKPLVASKSTKVNLNFVPDPEGKPISAIITRDTGAYTVEVPAGKYTARCLITNMEKMEAVPTAPPKALELTKNQEIDLDVTAK